MRADLFLFRTGACASRNAAAQAIKQGKAEIDGKKVKKASEEIEAPEGDWDERILTENRARVSVPDEKYVGRGGYKLEAALERFKVDVEGLVCCDIGASTGGFTDCLLQSGAKTVFAIDVGRGQLAEKIRNDGKVISIEGFNARYLSPELIGCCADVAVCDVSFISQSLLYPAISSTVRRGGCFISLIKPQFEVGKIHIKNGIVHDKKLHVEAIARLCETARQSGLMSEALCASPIKGGDGNTEYLALFINDPSGAEKLTIYDVIDTVYGKA